MREQQQQQQTTTTKHTKRQLQQQQQKTTTTVLTNLSSVCVSVVHLRSDLLDTKPRTRTCSDCCDCSCKESWRCKNRSKVWESAKHSVWRVVDWLSMAVPILMPMPMSMPMPMQVSSLVTWTSKHKALRGRCCTTTVRCTRGLNDAAADAAVDQIQCKRRPHSRFIRNSHTLRKLWPPCRGGTRKNHVQCVRF